jgi:hypothetical protein
LKSNRPKVRRTNGASCPIGHDDFYKSYVLFVGLVQRKIMRGARFSAIEPAWRLALVTIEPDLHRRAGGLDLG